MLDTEIFTQFHKFATFFSLQIFQAILIKGDEIDKVDWTSVIPLVAGAVAYDMSWFRAQQNLVSDQCKG